MFLMGHSPAMRDEIRGGAEVVDLWEGLIRSFRYGYHLRQRPKVAQDMAIAVCLCAQRMRARDDGSARRADRQSDTRNHMSVRVCDRAVCSERDNGSYPTDPRDLAGAVPCGYGLGRRVARCLRADAKGRRQARQGGDGEGLVGYTLGQSCERCGIPGNWQV